MFIMIQVLWKGPPAAQRGHIECAGYSWSVRTAENCVSRNIFVYPYLI